MYRLVIVSLCLALIGQASFAHARHAALPLSSEDPRRMAAGDMPPIAPAGSFASPMWPGGWNGSSLVAANSGELFGVTGKLYRAGADLLWETLPDPADHASESILVPSPNFAHDRFLMVGLDFGGDALRLSHDGGNSWTSPAKPVVGPVRGIAFSPAFAIDQTVYVTRPGVAGPALRSTDGGQHWLPINMPPHAATIRQLILSPYYALDRTLFALMQDGALWRSPDSALTWVRADHTLGTQAGNPVHSVALAPLGAGFFAIIAATEIAAVLSLDLGHTWYLIDWKTFSVISVPPDFAQTLTIYGVVPYTGQLLRSDDLGESWVEPPPGQAPGGVVFSPKYLVDRTAYAANVQQLWRTTDGGHSWHVATEKLPTDMGSFYSLRLSPNFEQDAVLVALSNYGSYTPMLVRSTDGARTWARLDLPAGGDHPLIEFSPAFAADGKLFLASGTTLYVSTSLGAQWSVVSALPFEPVALALSPNFAADQTMFIGHAVDDLRRSNNGGQTWVVVPVPEYGEFQDIVLSPGYPSDPTMFLIFDFRHFKTQDAGVTWTELASPASHEQRRLQFDLSPDFVQDNTVFMSMTGDSGGTFRSVDGGSNFVNITPSQEYWQAMVLGHAVSPGFAHDKTIAVIVVSEGIYLSEDAGETWFPLRGSPKSSFAFGLDQLAMAHKNGRWLPIATHLGDVYMYHWPALPPAPKLFTAGLPTGATGVVSVPLQLPAGTLAHGRAAWMAETNRSWLSVEPVTGSLPADIALKVNADMIGGGAVGAVTLHRYLSNRYVETAVIPVRAFWVTDQIWLPTIYRGFDSLGLQNLVGYRTSAPLTDGLTRFLMP